jgi:hypothetical protein
MIVVMMIEIKENVNYFTMFRIFWNKEQNDKI